MMWKSHGMARRMGLIGVVLALSAVSLNAAVLREDFEAYKTGQTLSSQNSYYDSSAMVVQDLTDPINKTRVIEQNDSATYTPITTNTLNLSGRVQLQLDLKLTGANGGYTQIYLYQFNADRPLWVQLYHGDGTESDHSYARVKVSGGNHTIGNFDLDKWYRLKAIVNVDPDDGAKSIIEQIALYPINGDGTLGDPVGQIENLHTYGNPTSIIFAEITNTAANGSTPPTAGRYDNWSVTMAPEPAAVSVLGLGILFALGRRKRKA